jgi:hypothetical protein
MSNSKNAIQEIKKLMAQFGFLKENFVNAKLVDGTEIKVEGESLAEGAKVLVITAEGEIPAPDGIHELEDGTKVETKDAIVTKIEEVLEAGYDEKNMEDVEVPIEVPAEIAPVADEVVGAIVEALMPLMEEVKVLVDEMKKMKDGMQEMKSDFDSFKKEPAGKKIADGKIEKFKAAKNDDEIDAKWAAITALRNNK